ncbi:hypothetical protein H5410_028867 [Solanum commersonii]|uniref:Uncharacterized protein n=1 Tax=Solanum commersonii TaxID=4109 RepID=A0A9J5Z657_SOLCO|nr:hypothetical protein H5410_028867 [Solanum commersonii]
MVDKMWETMFRWFGHVKRRCIDVLMRRYGRLVRLGTRRVDQKKFRGEVNKQDMVYLHLIKDMTPYIGSFIVLLARGYIGSIVLPSQR